MVFEVNLKSELRERKSRNECGSYSSFKKGFQIVKDLFVKASLCGKREDMVL